MPRYPFAILFAGFLLTADEAPKDAPAKEYAKFEGSWRVVALEVEGMKLPEEMIKESRLIIKGKEFTMRDKFTYRGTFTIDPAKKPKTMDLKFTEGPEKGNTSYAIYELTGDDLKLCLTVTGKNRPKEFAAKPGSGHGFEVLKRDKPKGE
jgi:uncharacterized protein (TIGR03067 family)